MGQCSVGCKQEFQLKNFGFHGVHPERFISFQWRLPVVLYILFHFALAVYTDFWLIYTMRWMGVDKLNSNSTQDSNSTFVLYPWPVYLTNWTYLLLTIYLNLHTLAAIFYTFSKGIPLFSWFSAGRHRLMFHELRTSPSLWDGEYDFVPGSNEVVTKTQMLPWYFKVTWILLNAASVASVMVTIIFFLFLWPQFDNSRIDMLNFQLHGLNSVIIFLEHCFTAVPYRYLHFLYPFIYLTAYLVMTIIFYAAGNTVAIYPKVLDWNNVGTTMIMVALVGLVVIPLLQAFFFAIYKIKLAVQRHFTDDEPELHKQPEL